LVQSVAGRKAGIEAILKISQLFFSLLLYPHLSENKLIQGIE